MSGGDSPALRILTTSSGPTTVLRIVGDLDLATAGLLRTRLRSLLAGAQQMDRLVLDLSGLDFLDVTGLNVIVEAQRSLAARGGALSLRTPRPIVVRMLTLLKLTDTIRVEP